MSRGSGSEDASGAGLESRGEVLLRGCVHVYAWWHDLFSLSLSRSRLAVCLQRLLWVKIL